ncbi:V-type ATP synthase subunit A [Candidatus Fermentibacteria bacterium]|nr:V-type ATP synthase subunit A [Candidatus Fermentibacteria bacterium]
MKQGVVEKVSGPLVVAQGLLDAKMYDVVLVSDHRLVGEVIELRGEKASIQVYEETGGLGPGEPVYSTGAPLSVELGPGLIESIYDGIQRPLDAIRAATGDLIHRGVSAPALNREKKWEFVPTAKIGTEVHGGDVLGTVQETDLVAQKIMVPPGVEGTLAALEQGSFTVEEPIGAVKTADGSELALLLMHRWPVRRSRPYVRKISPSMPLVTGQRVIDAFFPLGKGGTGCVPGPFGSGKTVIQHQLAKWADADIIVYVGCGERGNEMTDVLMEFPELVDPKSGKPLIRRTVLIANTSNMPVAAREASVYTGITIAEYFRDMGYSVAVMADSTSRWAEAMREMSGRLEEMPGEEGYPAYLGTRIAEFYERAGRVICAGSEGREGALSVVGAVSPPGGDLSDPVVQATLRVVKVFWSLEDKLAYKRHFPAINWLTSYSLYTRNLDSHLRETLGDEWIAMRDAAIALLQKEAELEEIARLVGVESLSAGDRLILETARSIREDFLHQNAFHEEDTYTSLDKQKALLSLIMHLDGRMKEALERKVDPLVLFAVKVRERIARAKFMPERDLGAVLAIKDEIDQEVDGLIASVTADILPTTAEKT